MRAELRISHLVCAAFTVLVLLSGVPESSADGTDEKNGNSLLRECGAALRLIDQTGTLSAEETLAAMQCLGFVRGATLALLSEQQWSSFLEKQGLRCKSEESELPLEKMRQAKRTCIPDKATSVQAIRVIVKYLQDHPAELHKADFELLATALQLAFPCK